MEKENLVENSKNIGKYLVNEINSISASGIKEVRGRGLMIGIEFHDSIKEIRNRLLFEERIFTGVAGTNTIRLLPPLCLSKEEADAFLEKFRKVLDN
jgi:acetylornithine aminotransferase